MASSEVELLAKCLDFVHNLVGMKQNGRISVHIGNIFNFDFSNYDTEGTYPVRKISPSKRKRNDQRRLKFEEEKLGIINDVQTNTSETETQTELIQITENGVNTDYVEVDRSESQTEIISRKEIGINTEGDEVAKLEDVLQVNENGSILPNKGEVLIEMSTSHDFKTWDEIEAFIKNNLSMTICGRPWIANSGRLYKTIGYRTSEDDFERWKVNTFNWQDSGVRKVSSSRIYR